MSATACTRRTKPKAPAAPEAPQAPAAWVNATAGGELIGRSSATIRRLAEAGHVRRHKPPGAMTLYSSADILKFAPPPL